MIGQTIRGYQILEELGAGGFGLVYKAYKAYEAALNRYVALKLILPQYANDSQFRQRFLIEAQVIAQLQDPHIVPLYAFWQDETGTYLVMRFIEGGNLRSYLDQQKALALHEVQRYLRQLCEALHTAHQAQVIHRDLKPENILLDKKGNAYLSDFGIAKQLNTPSNLTPSGGIVGSWKYLSPEQITNSSLSPATDLYALALMLYEMLTGEHPFAGSKGAEILTKQLHEPLPNICEKRQILPSAVNHVLQKASAKAAHDRFLSVHEFLHAFENAFETSNLIHTKVKEAPSNVYFPVAPPAPRSEKRERYLMLEQVKRFWIDGVLEQSLYQAVWLELGMQSQSDAVENPWNTLLKLPDTALQKLPAGTAILDIYDNL